MSSESSQWEEVGYITASQHRTLVIQELTDSPKTPTMITEQVPIPITHVSRSLGDLKDRGLVELLVPEDRRKGRVYGLTDSGSGVVGLMESEGMLDQ